MNLNIESPLRENLLKAVEFQFEPGKIYKICGSNGVGKTCFFRTLKNDPPMWPFASGSVQLPEGQITFLAQEPLKTIGETTLFEYLLPKHLILPEKELITLLQRFNISDSIIEQLRSRSSGLSGGEWQKLAFIKAVTQKSKLLIMDEPFSSMDLESRKIAYNLLKEYCADTIVLIVDHSNGTLPEYIEVNLENFK